MMYRTIQLCVCGLPGEGSQWRLSQEFGENCCAHRSYAAYSIARWSLQTQEVSPLEKNEAFGSTAYFSLLCIKGVWTTSSDLDSVVKVG